MFYCFLVVRIMAPLTHARMNEHSKQHHQRARCRVSQPVTGRVDVSPPFNGRTFEQLPQLQSHHLCLYYSLKKWPQARSSYFFYRFYFSQHSLFMQRIYTMFSSVSSRRALRRPCRRVTDRGILH